MQRVLSTVTLLGLLVATAAAFAITEHLKLVKGPISGARVSKTFSPVCRCSTDKAAIRIRLRHPDTVTVTIVDSARHTVATVATDVRRPKGLTTFLWDGRTDTGATVTSGTFQAEIALADARRTILLPNKIEVDTTVPKVLSVSDGTGVLVPGAKHNITIRYALSEDAHAVVYLGRHRIIRGRPSRSRAAVKWNGTRGGRTLPAGRYVLEFGGLDLAGNETPSSQRRQVIVVLRDIVLAPTRLRVRAGARFAVDVRTAAPKYTWRLGGKHGTAHGRVLRLRAPSHPGTYRLVVSAHGHSATALVRVRRR